MITAQTKTKYLLITLAVIGIAFVLFKSSWACGIWSYEEAAQCKIQPIDTYRELQSIFDSCDEKTLVTFDVDDTLITAHDVLARTGEPPLWFKICLSIKNLPTLLTAATREKAIDDFLGTLFQQAPRFVFDPDIVRLIRQLHQQKCTTVGLTAMGSSSIGTIKSMPEWRATMLNDFGIDFSGTFDDVSFTSFPANRNHYPCLYKGILCTNYATKGEVLGAFLDHYHLKPERIISFDDLQSALDTIADECHKRGISFVGYQMLGAKKLPGKWNTRRALLQFDTAMNHNHWLSDEAADAILAGNIPCA